MVHAGCEQLPRQHRTVTALVSTAFILGASGAQFFISCKVLLCRFSFQRSAGVCAATPVADIADASPDLTHISCHGSAGSRAFTWALCIASGHAARPKATNQGSLQPLERTPALHVTGLHNS